MTAFQRFLIERMLFPLLALVVAAWLLEEFIEAHWLSLTVGALAVVGVSLWLAR